ncbi:hypothetical protein [Shewanella indica]|uniref:hypothetical protein n=1 Tax=Shewanella indica TaxID=768528 RepID=UPI001F25584B|nr:hypothetical protein [Shewanella indica]
MIRALLIPVFIFSLVKLMLTMVVTYGSVSYFFWVMLVMVLANIYILYLLIFGGKDEVVK